MSGGIEDVTRADILNGRKGSYETSYTAIDSDFTTPSGLDVLIWTGVTNEIKYATTHLVLRKIPHGSFDMGSPAGETLRNDNETQHTVTLTKDFWIGVFPVTQRQHELMGGTNRSYFTNAVCSATRPVDNIVVKRDLRGQTVVSDVDQLTGDVVFSRLRTLTGNVASFDLPTEAQWEYACRALSTGPTYTGESYSEAYICKVGRSRYNGGVAGLDRNVDVSQGTASVGSYKPNAWGLYDMIGNVSELCRDNFSSTPTGFPSETTDPINREANGTATQNVIRGYGVSIFSLSSYGSYRVAMRGGRYYTTSEDAYGIGYRVSFTEK